MAKLDGLRAELAGRGVGQGGTRDRGGRLHRDRQRQHGRGDSRGHERRGHDLRDYALVVFGGAGGQHACAVARQLGIRTLIFDPLAGVLSAYGMGLAT